MTATVKTDVLKIVERTIDGVTMVGIPDEAQTYWAECDLCGKRSKGWIVGLTSAPNASAQEEADTHQCDLAGYFSTTEKTVTEFDAALFAHRTPLEPQ